MRSRRTVHELVVDILTEINKREHISISELVSATNTNSEVIKRWLDIIETIQNTPEIIVEGSDVFSGQDKIKVKIQSTRRHKRVESRFLLFSDEERGLSHDYYDSMFQLTSSDDHDLLLLDQVEATDMVLERTIHLTTDQEGSIPLPLWRFYRICRSIKHTARDSYATTSHRGENATQLLPIFEVSGGTPLELIRSLEGDITQPETWTTMSHDDRMRIQNDSRGRVILARIEFFTGSQELFVDLGDQGEPWEAKFWQILTVLTNTEHSETEIRRSYTEFLGTMVSQHQEYLATFEELTGVEMRHGVRRRENMSLDQWSATVHSFFHHLNRERDRIEKVATFLSWYKSIDFKDYPFFYFWIVSQIETRLQEICWPNVQLSWINTLSHVTRRTFGLGEIHLQKMAALIRRSFIVGNYYAVKLFISQIRSAYPIEEQTLYNDDISLLWFLVTMNLNDCSFSSRSRYPVRRFFRSLGTKGEVSIVEDKDYLGIVWVFNASQRRAIEQILEVISAILEGEKITEVVKSILQVPGRRIQQNLLLIYLGLPEFGMGRRFKRYKRMMEVMHSVDDGSPTSSLLWARLLLSVDTPDEILDFALKRIEEKMQELSSTEGRVMDQDELEFVHTSHELGKKLENISLVKMATSIPVIRKVRRTSTMSTEARDIVYQRLLPRRGRKASETPRLFFDLQGDHTYLELYRMILIREVLVKVTARFETEEI